jgi:hypothetical protein
MSPTAGARTEPADDAGAAGGIGTGPAGADVAREAGGVNTGEDIGDGPETGAGGAGA